MVLYRVLYRGYGCREDREREPDRLQLRSRRFFSIPPTVDGMNSSRNRADLLSLATIA